MKRLFSHFLLFLCTVTLCIVFVGLFTLFYTLNSEFTLNDRIKEIFSISVLLAVTLFIFKMKDIEKGRFSHFIVLYCTTVVLFYLGFHLFQSPKEGSINTIPIEQFSTDKVPSKADIFFPPQSLHAFFEDINYFAYRIKEVQKNGGGEAALSFNTRFLFFCFIVPFYMVSGLFASRLSVWNGFNVFLCVVLFRGLFFSYHFFSDGSFREIGATASETIETFFPELMVLLIGVLLFLIFIVEITGKREKRVDSE